MIAAIDVPPDFPIAGEPFREVLIERMSLGAAPDALFQFISYLTGGERRKKAQALARGDDPDGDAATSRCARGAAKVRAASGPTPKR